MSELLSTLRHLHTVIPMDPLLIFGIILMAGAAGGWLARKLKLPSITGNILAGALIGPSMLGLVPGQSTIAQLTPLSTFAMGLIMVSIGGHLSYRRIHNALKRIVWITLGEIIFCFCIVALVIRLFTGSFVLALLLGALSLSTGPGTNVALVRECHAKGSYVKTLLSVIALDNILSIVIFAFCLNILPNILSGQWEKTTLVNLIVQRILHLAGPLLLGWVLGKITEWIIHRPQFNNFSTVFIAILFCTGVSKTLALNPLLTCLSFGFYLANSTRETESQLTVLAPIEGILYITFFTMGGLMLHLNRLAEAGLLGAVYFTARLAGKGIGAVAGGILTGSSRRIWQNLPLGLLPQAGLAIALLVRMQEQTFIPAEVKDTVTTLVLAVVVVSEIIGPLAMHLALKRAQEINKDRPRLVEFLQEEFILMDLEARDKWAAMRQLCDFLILTHNVAHSDSQALFNSVAERERQETTAMGRGVAIPHGIIDSGPEIQGVLGISRKGIDFGAPDHQPVHIIMLICTPRDHAKRHLQVLAGLTAMIADDLTRARLIRASNANEAWEIIEYGERPNFNHFLED